MSSLIDLTGRVFGSLKVTNLTFKRQFGSVIWRCICVCGDKLLVSGASLRYGRTRSCGCLTDALISKANVRDDAARNKVWRMYTGSAKARSVKFCLTSKQFDALIAGHCHYCGVRPTKESVSFAGNKFMYNGIDRLNSRKGYTKANCVSCCRPCNMMKSATPYRQFLLRVFNIAERHKGER